jgi:hypothetical protein
MGKKWSTCRVDPVWTPPTIMRKGYIKFDLAFGHAEWKQFRKLLRLVRCVRRGHTERGRKVRKDVSTSIWIHLITLREQH